MKIEVIPDQKTVNVNELIIITAQYHEGFPENQKHFFANWIINIYRKVVKKVKGVATKHYSG